MGSLQTLLTDSGERAQLSIICLFNQREMGSQLTMEARMTDRQQRCWVCTKPVTWGRSNTARQRALPSRVVRGELSYRTLTVRSRIDKADHVICCL